jgi:hypothetical protein
MEAPVCHQLGTAPLARLSRREACVPASVRHIGFAAAWPTACFHAVDFARC